MTAYCYDSIQDSYSLQQSYLEVNQFTNFLTAEWSPVVAPDFNIKNSGSMQEAADCTSTTVFTR